MIAVFFFFSYSIWHKYFLFAFRCSHLKAGYHANDLMLLIIWSTHSYFWRFFFSFCISNLLDFQDMCVCVHTHTHMHTLSCVSLFVILQNVAHQATLSMEFSRQECRSELSFPSPGDLPDPGINPHLLHLLLWHAEVQIQAVNATFWNNIVDIL